ncbi:MAG: permease [Myxococcota bacterium]
MERALFALMLAIAALFVGPGLLWMSNGSSRLRAALDGLILALVSGLCLLYLGPHALDSGGFIALLGIIAGASVPILLHRFDRGGWWAKSALALLSAHAVVDGAALGILDASLAAGVGTAVVAHRLPVGLAISLRAQRTAHATAILLGIALFTVIGFGLGVSIGHGLPPAVHALLEGMIIGGLLHVVVTHPIPPNTAQAVPKDPPSSKEHLHGEAHGHTDCAHDHGHAHHTHHHEHHHHEHHHHAPAGDEGDRRASAGGALMGIIGLAVLAWVTRDTPALAHLQATGQAFVSLSLTSAPALLAGFILAGLLSALIDPARAGWLAGSGHSGRQALRGVVFGLPLPVCSCGVVPMYASLIRRGVPVTAGLAFLVATPELGLDAVLLSVPLLGIPLTIARVLAAFAVAVAVALAVGGKTTPAQPTSHVAKPHRAQPVTARLLAGLRYGLVELVDHTLPWILVGLLLAALAEPLLDHALLASLPPAIQVPLAALIGVPLYVCASGATPLAAVAMHKGLSAGAALTFLLAGPATNVTTFGVLSSLHGRGVALRFGAVLTISAVFVGWGIDIVGITMPEMVHPGAAHAHTFPLLSHLSALALLGLAGASLWRQGARGVVEQILNPVHVH